MICKFSQIREAPRMQEQMYLHYPPLYSTYEIALSWIISMNLVSHRVARILNTPLYLCTELKPRNSTFAISWFILLNLETLFSSTFLKIQVRETFTPLTTSRKKSRKYQIIFFGTSHIIMILSMIQQFLTTRKYRNSAEAVHKQTGKHLFSKTFPSEFQSNLSESQQFLLRGPRVLTCI